MSVDTAELTALGRRVLLLEAASVKAVADRLDVRFTEAIELLKEAKGRVIVSGVGKSGLVARKIAATLTSTGTPASYLHPVDSMHGDLGIVDEEDVAIVLSKSGDSEELSGLVESLRSRGVPIIAITGGLDSLLARTATVVLDASVAEEACPHDLTPTASTTVALALGDALAVTLLEVKGFGREAFAALHPGGRLARKMLLRVRDVMIRPGRILGPDSNMTDAVVSLAHDRGLAMIAEQGRLVGVITTGDLTRLVEKDPDFHRVPVLEVMTRTPKTVGPEELAAAAVGMMRRGVIALPVIDQQANIVGVVHLHDLMRAGAV
ncbi:MAG TPA: KpsF/GutQ family sugar-phosphate isomerase [Gemmatimonadales bacterium]